jgi:Protein of unknown function (DUF559)
MESEDELLSLSKEKLKEWFTTDNMSGYKSTEKYMLRHYPELYKKILNNSNENNITFLKKILLYLNCLHEIPICPECGNKCTFKGSIKRGLSTFCSSYCSNKSEATIQKKIIAANTDEHIKNLPNAAVKRKNTNIKKFGVDNVMKSDIIKNKLIETNIKKFGVDCVFKSEKIKNKIKKTNLKRYGVGCSLQNKEIKEKAKQTMIDKYGEIYYKYIPSYNVKSIIYLDMISEKLDLPIQHALNGGEKKFVKYWVDGYIEKYNICIEWDETGHNETKQKERDLIRENYLKEKHKCHIIRINEKEFLKNVEESIKLIFNQINFIISSA